MTDIVIPQANFVFVDGGIFNTTSAHTVTLGPFGISQNKMAGLWLLYLDFQFGVPTTAVNEDVFLQDIGGFTVKSFHCNCGIAPMPPTIIRISFPWPGFRASTINANQQQFNLVFPATTSGPTASANMHGYLV